MTIFEAMASCGLTRAKLTRVSGIPESTLRDILSGETALENCKAITVSKLAKALHLSVESVLQLEPVAMQQASCEIDGLKFFAFTRNWLLDILYGSGKANFIRAIQQDKTVEWLFAEQHDASALWLIGLMDYLCDGQDISRLPQYDRYRKKARCVLEGHFLCPSWLLDDEDDPLPLRHALPQFLRHGIIETEETLKQY